MTWIEKDGNFGPNLSEEKVFPDDVVEEGVVVIRDYCTECTCQMDGSFSCKNITRELPAIANQHPYPDCYGERCGKTGREVVNMTASCQCAENETLTRVEAPKCCECVSSTPSPSSVPPTTSVTHTTVIPTTLPTGKATTKLPSTHTVQPQVFPTTQPPVQTTQPTVSTGLCQLSEETGTLRVDDSDGNKCESDDEVIITTCKGSCPSWDKSTVRFVASSGDTATDDIQHPKDCQCCSGTGDWVTHNVSCFGIGRRRVQVLHFTQCGCNACVEASMPLTPPGDVIEPPEILASGDLESGLGGQLSGESSGDQSKGKTSGESKDPGTRVEINPLVKSAGESEGPPLLISPNKSISRGESPGTKTPEKPPSKATTTAKGLRGPPQAEVKLPAAELRVGGRF